MANQECLSKQGFAYKPGGIFKTWQKRWFVLDGNVLNYSKKPGQKSFKTINMKEAEEITLDLKNKRKNVVFIRTDKKKLYLQFKSEKETQEWMKELAQAKQGRKKVTIQITDFTVLKVIGRGSYGKVQLVKHKSDGQLYALKSLSKRFLADYNLIGKTLTERNALLKANHPFLTSARYSFQSPTKLFLALEYVPGGELFTRLCKERKFSEDRVKLYVAQLVLALCYLHSIGIVHRDLKLENILVDEDGYIKLTDFGLAKEKMDNEGDRASTFCGTPDYVAPEMLLSKPYDKAVDWWSLGILTYEMLYGRSPFYNSDTNVMFRSIVYDPVEFPVGGSNEVIDFISKLLEKDPAKRLGSGPNEIDDVQNHPFFEGVDWEGLLLKTVPMEWKPNLCSDTDTSQFDKQFTNENPVFSYENPELISAETQEMLQGFTMENACFIDTLV
ncbi:AGC family protein kinase [Histomonas meleagridis]|uniref:AGC family protein kinase n=1 Tax=Histomonas meleagridis TaxID=135588 RepID=UPI00355999C1|nr:AGC family protein kinase [Histomonas meleagridis]KAH0798380.1 AGC family protein kinase [Histomonas meleagridis]